MKTCKHWTALLLCLALLCSLLPQFALTAHAEELSGSCGAAGENLLWELNPETGVLTVTGSGEMKDYEKNSTPWYDHSESISSLVLPEGLTSVGSYAFAGCTRLASVSVPSSLKAIGDYAFSDCSALTAFPFPNGMEYVGIAAFQNCAGLTSITLPASLMQIDMRVFSGCSGLTNVTFPEELYSIKGEAFLDCTGLTELAFPQTLQTIDFGAFQGCTGLTSLELPSSVNKLGESVFYRCSGLTSITLSPSIEDIPYYAFADCSGLKSVTIPQGVCRIGMCSFYCCKALESLSLPSSLLSIDQMAFLGCPLLSAVTIPQSVRSVDSYAFGYDVDEDYTPVPVSGFTITGYAESVAERYAKKNDFAFIALTPIVNPFVDVNERDFFFDPVLWAVENEVTSGRDATHFAPHETVKRSEAMLFFYAAKGRPKFTTTKSPFKDVKKKHWFYDAVLWAVENKITSGTDATHFSPNKTCVRSEILQFLYAAMDKPKYTIANPYSDVKPKHWYYDGAIWAYENGLEKGENGKFKAKTACTRAYVVTYLYRFITGKALIA